MHKLVLLRHGQSVWNQENRFTGWVDVSLSEQGEQEARAAGELLKKEGFTFDVAHTSVLKRAIETLWSVLRESDQMWLPVHKTWRLNERHYGGLQGLNKKETADKYGADQVFQWRRSYDVLPPALDVNDPTHPSKDRRYNGVDGELPSAEALKETKARVMPYWEEQILPGILRGQRTIIAAHGNSLRALIQHLDKISEAEIAELNIPTGIPLVYDLDERGEVIRSEYLGDPEAAKKAAEAVANQAKG